MNRSDLISYASNFASFLIRKARIDKIILFGSVASGEFDEKSDIDLFIETEQPKNKIDKILELYNMSEDNEKYRLSGIKNDIRIKVGRLDEWKSLKRSIISNGIILYGKYTEAPKDIKPYLLFTISLEKIPRSRKIRIWRKLYGYRQKVGKKTYESRGVAGKRLGHGAFIVPVEKSDEVLGLLKKEKISYGVIEVWSKGL